MRLQCSGLLWVPFLPSQPKRLRCGNASSASCFCATHSLSHSLCHPASLFFNWPARRLQTERGNHKGLLSGCFDPSPRINFIVPHCPRFRQVEQRQSHGACRGESSQALAKLIRRQPRPKLSKSEPHKPHKMGKFRRICSTPYTPPSLFNSGERSQVEDQHICTLCAVRANKTICLHLFRV